MTSRPAILLATLLASTPAVALDPIIASNLLLTGADGFFSGAYPIATNYFYPQCLATPFTLSSPQRLTSLTFWGSSDNTVSSRLTNVRGYEVRLYDASFTTPALQFTLLRGPGVLETRTQRFNASGGEEYEVRVPLSGTLGAGTWWLHVGAQLVDPDGDAWMWTEGARKGLRYTTFSGAWSAWQTDAAAGVAYDLRGQPACPADLDGSRQVDFSDVALVMLEFGPCPGCDADLDGSGTVDLGDVAVLLLEMGPCP